MAMWMRAALTGLALCGGPAGAQDWFTPETCRVERAEVRAQAYPPDLEARLAAEAAKVPNGVGRLWKITSAEGAVSHLWGTYHTPHPALLDLPAAFRAVLAEARVVALEFDPTPDSRDDAREAYAVDWMWQPDWAPPQDRSEIPPEVLDWIGRRMSDIGWDAGYLPQMSDAGLLSLLLTDPCGDYLAGVLPGQDYLIAQQAALAGIEVTGLQEPEDLGRQLNDPLRAAQARAAVILYAAYLGPEGALPDARATAFALYLQGRLAELDLWAADWLAAVLGPAEAARVLRVTEDYILVERNGFFVLAARPLLDSGGAVLAVGAAHLPGELGMVEMLRDAGYRVERVLLPGEVP
ncbi:TraB/GumN family protein [Rhodobacter sp. Har01]|uniref:TraB/GumN family protein n=1 Tax=Rhodobacter sp. Har01 TaxID=2883999 RepID=UPI001D09381D|nr:TraB/GumN family protein [Rhodobacter sp. Har01]MCB6176959.1 TraB/GumN family protein [Rhodobacter sp. Har01]